MGNTFELLLEHAALVIRSFDIHTRTKLREMNRTVPYYIMSYHKIGRAKLEIEGTVYTVEPGSVVLIPSNTLHSHYKDSNEETVFLWWSFTYSIAECIDVLRFYRIPYVFRLQHSDAFERVFTEFVTAYERPAHLPRVLYKNAKALELLYLLLESALATSHATMDESYDPTFVDMLRHIVQRPEEELSLSDLAERYHLHPVYISSRFKSLFGRTLSQVQLDVRMQKARRLLESTSMSVAAVGEEVGYDAIQSFTRFFTGREGVSPTDYRRRKGRYI